jgi:hypothetical protein
MVFITGAFIMVGKPLLKRLNITEQEFNGLLFEFIKNKDKSYDDVAENFCCHKDTIKKYIEKFNLCDLLKISKTAPVNIRLGVDFSKFSDDFVVFVKNNNPTILEIMNNFNIEDSSTVRKYIETFNLEKYIRYNEQNISLYERLKITKSQLKILLIEKLKNDNSIPQIAQELGVSSTSIAIYCQKFKISRRVNLRNKDWLYQKYIVEQLSSGEIALLCEVTASAVLWHLHKKGIPVRDESAAQQLAEKKRNSAQNFLNVGASSSRGYNIYFNQFSFRSAAEYVWYKMNKNKFETIEYEPFLFHHYIPDFLVNNNKIFEIKGGRNLSDKEIKRYEEVAYKLKKDLNIDFEIVYMDDDENKKEYDKFVQRLKRIGASVNAPFTLLEEI